jgi:hypothetical protein
MAGSAEIEFLEKFGLANFPKFETEYLNKMAETAETGVAKFGLADFKKLRSNDYF